MRVEIPLLLYVAPAAALIVAVLALLAGRRRIRLARAWSPAVGERARRGLRGSVLLLTLAGLAAAFGLAGPRAGRAARLAEGRGINVLIAVDISRSMLAEDADPSRLRRAVREARRLLQDLSGDRVGIIAFAGQSYVLSPLTLDHSAADMYLEALDPDLASAGGTNLSVVLEQASRLLEASLEGGDRALVLFSDGEGHDSLSDGLDAARGLASNGVRTIVVAEGGARPVRIPLRDATGAVTDYKRDADGNIVETARDDETLRAIAAAAEGDLVAAEVPDQAGAVRDVLQGLSRRPLRERRLADLRPVAWVAGLAAALLLLLQTATRRSAALAGLGALVLTGTADAQRPSRGQRLLEEGRVAAAATEFVREARTGVGGDTAWFNAGTAALAAGEYEPAREALERAARTLDPDLRFRVLYNLGLAHLLAARADSSIAQAREPRAAEMFRQALLLRPSSQAAKWNLELLERPPPPPQSGAQSRQNTGQSPSEAQEPEGLSPSEAEALLSSVERGELLTRQSVARRQRLRTAASLKDW